METGFERTRKTADKIGCLSWQPLVDELRNYTNLPFEIERMGSVDRHAEGSSLITVNS